MKINNRFELEQEVYLKTDPEQYVRIVSGIFIRPGGVIKYELCCEVDATVHYEFEISRDKDELIKVR